MSNVLFVCTANICRSPAAEGIARARYGHAGHNYASAGFLYDGREAEPDMQSALRKIGVEIGSHRSQIIDPDSAADAEVILTMESRHVQDIAMMSEDLFSRTLPLAEAAERMAGRRMSVHQLVAELKDRDPRRYLDSRWDVEDPYKRSKRKYRKAVEEIAGLVDSVIGRFD